MKRILAIGLLGLGAIGILLAVGVWGGLHLATLLDKPSSIPARALVRLESRYNSYFRTEESVIETLPTSRVNLKRETLYFPLETAHYAGGITSVGGTSVVVIDRQGKFFHADDGRVTRLGIQPPDNNVDGLRADDEAGRFGNATIDFNWFRYNDILHLERADEDWLLASFSEWNSDAFCFTSTLARLSLPKGSAPSDWQAETADWSVLSRTAPCLEPLDFGRAIRGLEAGGRLAVLDEDTVIWTSGAYERDDFVKAETVADALAQRDDVDYGKVLAVDLETGDLRHIAKGLRNPQGVAVTPTGDIWVTDHGMRGGDELNKVTEGANFGWPAVTYGTRYDGRPALKADRFAKHDGYDQPALAFVPGIAPGSLTFIDNFHYAWDGDLLVGAFRGDLHRVHFEEDRAIYDEVVEIGVRPRDLAMLDDGRIAIWTDFRSLVFLTAEQDTSDPIAAIEERIAALQPDVLSRDVAATFESCIQCHGFVEDQHGGGPSLHGICGQTPGSIASYEGYSGALGQIDGVWTAETISRFAANPLALAPGTNMAWSGIEDPRTATALGEVLCPQDAS